MYADAIVPSQLWDVLNGEPIEIYVHDWGILDGRTVVQFSTNQHSLVRYHEISTKPLTESQMTRELVERRLELQFTTQGYIHTEIYFTGWALNWGDSQFNQMQ